MPITPTVEFEAMNATLENENEWMTKAEATGPITFTIRLAQKARVVGIWLLHGEHGKLFTQVEVKAKDGHQKSTMVIRKLETSLIILGCNIQSTESNLSSSSTLTVLRVPAAPQD